MSKVKVSKTCEGWNNKVVDVPKVRFIGCRDNAVYLVDLGADVVLLSGEYAALVVEPGWDVPVLHITDVRHGLPG